MFGNLSHSRIFRVSLSALAFSLFSGWLIFLFPPIAYAVQVSLAWNPSASSNVAGYKVYYGTASKSYQFTNDAGNTTTIAISNLQDGSPYYFAVTAYDTLGRESDFSNEVSYNATPACQYAITPTSQSVGFSGGGGTVSVSSQSGCTWTAVSNVSWAVITSNSSGMGNGAVNYSVSANSSASSRTGTLTVAGQTSSITQSGTPQYTLSLTKSGTGTGTVTNTPAGTTFSAGMVVTLTASPDAKSTFTGWSGGCTGTSSTCSVTMNSNTSVTATFTLKTYTITASADPNGSISPQGTVTVNHGSSQSFTITPNSGYRVADVKVDGVSVGAVNSYSFTNVTTNHTIQASFGLPTTYTLSLTQSGTGTGTVTNTPAGTIFNAGTVVTLTASPDAKSTFTGWSGGCSGTSPTCMVTMNSSTSVTATFTLQTSENTATLQTYVITAKAGANGSISPMGSVRVNRGASQKFSIIPKRGYKISNVKVDGVSIGKPDNYLFGNVQAAHRIEASFASDGRGRNK